MYGKELVKNVAIVPIPPQDSNDAIIASCWVNMSQYKHATVLIAAGDTVGGTMAVTLDQAKDGAGTGTKTLAFTKYYSSGQKLLITGQSALEFTVGETVTGGSGSTCTAEVEVIASTYLLVRNLTNGTTWTDGETLTGGTSGATATVSGTGESEEKLLEEECSSTFTIPAVTYKTYAIEIEDTDLDKANDFDHFQVDIADAGAAAYVGGFIILSKPRYRGVDMPDVLGAKKITSTFA